MVHNLFSISVLKCQVPEDKYRCIVSQDSKIFSRTNHNLDNPHNPPNDYEVFHMNNANICDVNPKINSVYPF